MYRRLGNRSPYHLGFLPIQCNWRTCGVTTTATVYHWTLLASFDTKYIKSPDITLRKIQYNYVRYRMLPEDKNWPCYPYILYYVIVFFSLF